MLESYFVATASGGCIIGGRLALKNKSVYIVWPDFRGVPSIVSYERGIPLKLSRIKANRAPNELVPAHFISLASRNDSYIL